MFDNIFSETFFPSLQSKSPLVQFEAISSPSVAAILGEEPNSDLPPPPVRQF